MAGARCTDRWEKSGKSLEKLTNFEEKLIYQLEFIDRSVKICYIKREDHGREVKPTDKKQDAVEKRTGTERSAAAAGANIRCYS